MKKLVAYYKQLQAPAKASMWFLVSAFLQKGIAMLTTPLFTRIMTEEAFGQYSVYNSWLNIVTAIASLNLAAGVYTRGLVVNEDDEAVFTSSMLGLSTACIGVVFAVYLLFRELFNTLMDMSTLLMVIMFIEIWAVAVSLFWHNRERVNFRYKKVVVVTAAYVILSSLLSVVAILLGDPGSQVELRAGALALVGLVLYTPMFVSLMKRGKTPYSAKYWKYALAFNIPLVPHYLSQIILNQSDRLMIDFICGEEFVAYYSVAYSIAAVMLILNNSISGVMNPWIYKAIKNSEVHKIGKVSYMVLGLIAAANVLVIAIAPELLKILGPDSYQAALWVIPPITASVYFMFLYNLFSSFGYYFKKTNYVMVVSLGGAIFNVVLNYIFINLFGFVAAGYTTLVCYILIAICHYLFMKKVCREYMEGCKVYNIRIILLIGFSVVVASGIFMCLYAFPVVRYVLLATIAIAVCVYIKIRGLDVIKAQIGKSIE